MSSGFTQTRPLGGCTLVDTHHLRDVARINILRCLSLIWDPELTRLLPFCKETAVTLVLSECKFTFFFWCWHRRQDWQGSPDFPIYTKYKSALVWELDIKRWESENSPIGNSGNSIVNSPGTQNTNLLWCYLYLSGAEQSWAVKLAADRESSQVWKQSSWLQNKSAVKWLQ